MSGFAQLCELIFAGISAHCAYRRVYSDSCAESEAGVEFEAGAEPDAGAESEAGAASALPPT